jgi:hypothetical protein
MKIFMLGAIDPEMDMIQNMLDQMEIPYVFAMKDGKRVWPNNAYQADTPDLDPNNVICIECRPAEWKDMDITYIDHHDPYFKPRLKDIDMQNTFFKSSIGQLIVFLSENNTESLNKLNWPGAGVLYEGTDAQIEFKHADNKFVIQSGDFTVGAYIEIPKEVVAVGVVDHNICDAYHEHIRGVTNAEAHEWRKNYMKEFFKATDKEMTAAYAKFEDMIKKPLLKKYLILKYDFGEGYTLEKEVAKDVIFWKKMPTVVTLKFGGKENLMFYGFSDKNFDKFIEDHKDMNIQDNRERNYVIAS